NIDLAAFMLARCSQDKYFAFIDAYYSGKHQSPVYSTDPKDALIAIARAVGHTEKSAIACLSNQGILDGLHRRRNRAAKYVSATPIFCYRGEARRKGRRMGLKNGCRTR